MKRAVRVLATLYLIALLVLWGFIHFDTGNLWQVTLFLFSPRWAVAIPLVVLVPLTLLYQFRLTWAYALHALIIVFPIMDCRIGWSSPEAKNAGQTLRVMTYNVGGGKIHADRLMALAKSQRIDVIMLQECPGPLAKTVFQELGWTRRQQSNIAIGSSLELGELQILAKQPHKNYHSIAAVSCELRLPAGFPTTNHDDDGSSLSTTVRLVTVHFPTFRPAFERALQFDVDAGAAIEELAIQYGELVEPVVHRVDAFDVPTIVAGDFNVPVDSASYRDHWSHYQNALSIAATGLRYTKHTRLHGIRIDHVLADGNWSVASAVVGPDLGGDHRPVIVDLVYDQPAEAPLAGGGH